LVTKTNIDSALTAHDFWKKRLRNAIEYGTSEYKPEVVEKDHTCQFGLWLYSLSEEDKSTEDFEKVKDLHAQFHKVAANILELAITDKKEEALKQMDFGGAYSKVSSKLIVALHEWKSNTKQTR
jgi:hypothetical protein